MTKLTTQSFILFLSLFLTRFAKDQYCVSSSDNELQCGVCAASYNSQGFCLPPEIKINHCLFYSNPTSCSSCQLGYFITESGSCEQIPIKSCLKINSAFDCMACNKTVMVSNNNCENTSNRCEIKNCQICGFDSKKKQVCQICRSGYSLVSLSDGAFCQRLPQNSLHCMKADKDQFPDCLFCEIGFYIENGKCLKSNAYYDSMYSVHLMVAQSLLMITFLAIFK